MVRSATLVLGALLLVFLVGSQGQRPLIIFPTYRPPPQRPQQPIIRTARDAGEPQWLFKGDDVQRAPATGDHPYLPKYIDDIKLDPNRRYARSLPEEDASEHLTNLESQEPLRFV